jgi:HK97 family phage portal protein
MRIGNKQIRLTRGRSEQRTLTAGNVPSVFLQSTPGGANVTPQTSLTIADAWACVRALSDAAASLPLVAYRTRQDGSRERYSGRVVDLLDRPAPAMSQVNLIGQVVCHLNTWGNAFLGKYRDGDGNIAQLGCLPPDRVSVELKRGVPRYTLTQNDRVTEHDVGDILHIKGLTTDGLVGLSPVRQCRTALGLSSNLVEHAATFFENDARPGGILTTPSAITSQVNELAANWDAKHKGGGNAHRIAVMTGELNWIPVSMPLDDAQFLEQRQLSATEIARIFRVPPWVIGAATGDELTYSNVTNQAEYFIKFSLLPWLRTIEAAFTNDRDLSPQSVYLEFLLDALLRPDHATRAQVYTAALNSQTGWMTRAEVRRLENLDPDDDEEPQAPQIAPPPVVAVPTNGGTTNE